MIWRETYDVDVVVGGRKKRLQTFLCLRRQADKENYKQPYIYEEKKFGLSSNRTVCLPRKSWGARRS